MMKFSSCSACEQSTVTLVLNFPGAKQTGVRTYYFPKCWDRMLLTHQINLVQLAFFYKPLLCLSNRLESTRTILLFTCSSLFREFSKLCRKQTRRSSTILGFSNIHSYLLWSCWLSPSPNTSPPPRSAKWIDLAAATNSHADHHIIYKHRRQKLSCKHISLINIWTFLIVLVTNC